MSAELQTYAPAPSTISMQQGDENVDDEGVKQVDVTSEGLIIVFDDGREGLLRSADARDCVDMTEGFTKLDQIRSDAEED